MSLITSVNDLIVRRKKYLEQAIEAKRLLEELSIEIKDLSGNIDSNFRNELDISIWKSTVEVIQALNRLGVTFEKAKIYNSDKWYVDGKVTLDTGTTINITAYEIDAPLNCHMEQYEETVTKYRSVCE